MDIRGFLESSIAEWDNHISAVIWVNGCNWRCPFCHGANLVLGNLPPINKQNVIDAIDSKKDWLDGLCVTGGEPTLQPDLEDFINAVALPTKLETNGSQPKVLRSLIKNEYLQCVAMDFKTTPSRLNELGANVPDWELGFGTILGFEGDIEFHTTLCPTYVDVDTITEIGLIINNIGTWYLQQYNPKTVLNVEKAGYKIYRDSELDDVICAAKSLHNNVIVKGI